MRTVWARHASTRLEFFNEAKILGGISLAEILAITPSLSALARTQDGGARIVPIVLRPASTGAPDVTGADSKLLIPRADSGKPPTRLTMDGVVRTPHDPARPATVDATASLNNFKVNLFGFIILWFEQLTFVAKNGQKPDVTVRAAQRRRRGPFRRAAGVRQRAAQATFPATASPIRRA